MGSVNCHMDLCTAQPETGEEYRTEKGYKMTPEQMYALQNSSREDINGKPLI